MIWSAVFIIAPFTNIECTALEFTFFIIGIIKVLRNVVIDAISNYYVDERVT